MRMNSIAGAAALLALTADYLNQPLPGPVLAPMAGPEPGPETEKAEAPGRTATGRLETVRDANLQSLLPSSEEGQRIRDAFIGKPMLGEPGTDRKKIAADLRAGDIERFNAAIKKRERKAALLRQRGKL